jgi:glycosyltransferase involved in cell wall biosynthesis
MVSNDHRIKIAILDQSPDLGGAEVSILTFLKRMDRSRFDATVILPFAGPFSRALEAIEVPARIIHLPMGLVRLKRGKPFRSFLILLLSFFLFHFFLLKLCLYLRRNCFQLVVTNTIKAHLYGSIAARLCSIPLVWRFHDILSPPDFSPLLIKLVVFFGKFFPEKILAVSRTTEDQLIEKGVDRKKIRVIFNGIDEDRFKVQPGFRDIREEYRLENGAKLIGCIGRIIPQKGHKIFLSAIPGVIRERPETFFLIIGEVFLGEDAYQKELLEMVERNGIEKRVFMTGFRPDIEHVIRSLDIVVLPSIAPEAFGLTLLEAMVLKKPVIASDIGGVKEIIEDGVHGFLVEPNRSGPIAERILYLLTHPDMANQMAERAQERVHQRFSLTQYITGMEQACREAVFKEEKIASRSRS